MTALRGAAPAPQRSCCCDTTRLNSCSLPRTATCLPPLRRVVTAMAMADEDSGCCSTSAPTAAFDRRAWLVLATASAVTSLPAGRALAAGAEQDDGAMLDAELPSAAPPTDAAELPRAYIKLARKLAAALRDSIEAEASGATEFEVRRKADPAKELVREFVGRWRDDAAVAGDASHAELVGAISELGAFYMKAGPRSALSAPVRDAVLAHLAAAEAALPLTEKKSLLGL